VGTWPLNLRAESPASERAVFAGRIVLWREKSLREAKLRSSWAAPDREYEAAHRQWIEALLDPGRSAAFWRSLTGFVARIAGAGAINGVVQAGLRCLWPGIPDLYQGAELWDFSLVDPDNRRPVEYGLRQAILTQGRRDWVSGGIKENLIARLLNWRRNDAVLFTAGTLEPVPVSGPRAAHVLAFTRRSGHRAANVAVVLHVGREELALGQMPEKGWWAETLVEFATGTVGADKLFCDGPVFAEPQLVAGHPDAAPGRPETIEP
jgi:(1->4)-alpha-D-glucan 1-alpha-D-glucosylmutase